jgi:probable rRNA maturation factor
MVAVTVDVQVACDDTDIPAAGTIQDWMTLAVEAADVSADGSLEVAVRVVEPDEIQVLNALYRDKDEATNVMAFPAGPLQGLPADAPVVLGDVVVCAAVVAAEAREQGKRSADHWAHMLVHGILHLLGYDHQEEAQAAAMESLEAAVLARRGIANPYTG